MVTRTFGAGVRTDLGTELRALGCAGPAASGVGVEQRHHCDDQDRCRRPRAGPSGVARHARSVVVAAQTRTHDRVVRVVRRGHRAVLLLLGDPDDSGGVGDADRTHRTRGRPVVAVGRTPSATECAVVRRCHVVRDRSALRSGSDRWRGSRRRRGAVGHRRDGRGRRLLLHFRQTAPGPAAVRTVGGRNDRCSSASGSPGVSGPDALRHR